MTPWLDIDGLKARTVMPDEDFATLPVTFIQMRIAICQSNIEARLRKRYAVPFDSPVSEVVLGWLVSLVTVDLYDRRGWDPASEAKDSITEASKRALEEIREAADAKDGLYDLPLREDATSSAVTRGGPKAYSEASPFAWRRVQATRARYGR